MNIKGKKITLHDMCLRDGMHAKRHQINVDDVIRVTEALDEAGVPMIEVTHGDGLGGNSVNYGFAASSDQEMMTAAVKTAKKAKYPHYCCRVSVR